MGVEFGREVAGSRKWILGATPLCKVIELYEGYFYFCVTKLLAYKKLNNTKLVSNKISYFCYLRLKESLGVYFIV